MLLRDSLTGRSLVDDLETVDPSTCRYYDLLDAGDTLLAE